MELRRRIKDLIDDHDTTQKKLAERFHVSESTMSTYMTGKYRMPAWCVKEFAEYFLSCFYGLFVRPHRPAPATYGLVRGGAGHDPALPHSLPGATGADCEEHCYHAEAK